MTDIITMPSEYDQELNALRDALRALVLAHNVTVDVSCTALSMTTVEVLLHDNPSPTPHEIRLALESFKRVACQIANTLVLAVNARGFDSVNTYPPGRVGTRDHE